MSVGCAGGKQLTPHAWVLVSFSHGRYKFSAPWAFCDLALKAMNAEKWLPIPGSILDDSKHNRGPVG
jgi:hypothetical protein